MPSYLGVTVRAGSERAADEAAASDTLGQIEHFERKAIALIAGFLDEVEPALHIDRKAAGYIDDFLSDLFHSERRAALDEAGLDSSDTWDRTAAVTALGDGK